MSWVWGLMHADTFSLPELLSMLRRFRWAFIGVVTLTVGLGALLTILQTQHFVSTSSVLIRTEETSALFPLDGAVSRMRTIVEEREFVESTAFLLAAEEITPADAEVTTNPADERSQETTIVFLATAESPEAAQFAAQAWADLYISLRHDFDLAEVSESSELLQTSLERLDTDRVDLLAPIESLTSDIQDAANQEQDAATRERLVVLTAERDAHIGATQVDLLTIDGQRARLNTSLADLEVDAELLAQPDLSARVIQAADLPTDSSDPSIRRNLLLALLCALVLGVGAVFLLDALDDRIRTTDHLADWTTLQQISAIPKIGSSIEDAAIDHAYQRVLSTLDLAAGVESASVVMLTSGLANEGKTTATTALGRLSAAGGNRTLLIDGDLHRPAIGKMLGVQGSIGLIEFILGEAEIDDIVLPVDGVSGLDVVLAGTRRESRPAVDLLRDPALTTMVDKLRDRYDRIFIDSPPLLAVVDAIELATVTDTSILVVGIGVARAGSVSEADRTLRAAHVPTIGTIVIGTEPKRSDVYTYDYGVAE
jgi:capsular exopolysaccharide synthesis family protein